jgi:DNA repair photolyase
MDNPITCKEIQCVSALNKLKRKVPYGWDLNIYRGCSHACRYCYAIYSHQYLNSDGFYDDIHVKTNILEQLERELSAPTWQRDVINIGGVTDSYQKVEESYQLMPQILKLLIKYKTPAIISTKSTLVLRDYDLINELSQITYINIAATVTTMDEEVRRKIEPGGASSAERFAMLRQFRQTNASIGLHVMPIIPFLTDSRENIEALCTNAKDCGVHYLLPGTLYLRGETRKVFFDFIQQSFPDLYPRLQALFKTGGADKEYKNRLYLMVNELRDRYGISSSYSKPMKEKMRK